MTIILVGRETIRKAFLIWAICATLFFVVDVVFGAMVRDELLIEQSRFNQACSDDKRGANIWLPLGRDAQRWQFWRMREHYESVDGVTCWDLQGHYTCRVYDGTYIPAACVTSKPDELEFHAGDWNEFITNGWMVIQSNNSNRPLEINVPPDTTDLYMYAYCNSNYGIGTLSLESGSADLIKTLWDFSDTGDFANGNGSYPNYFSFAKIANDCNDAVFYLTPPNNGKYISVAGFVAVNKDSVAQPDTGVFDPETLISLLPPGQSSTGPALFNFNGDAGTSFWWGMGHWVNNNGNNTLINESQILSYGTNATEWFPDENQWVRQKTKVFYRLLMGDIRVYDGLYYYNVGRYRCLYRFTSTGLITSQRLEFNSDAELCNLYTNSPAGLCGQWSLKPEHFDKAMAVPYNSIAVDAVGPFNHTDICMSATSALSMSGNQNLAAFFIADGRFYCDGGIKPVGQPRAFIRERTEGFHKFYCYWAYGTDDIPIKDGDIMEGIHLRLLTDTYGMIPESNVSDLNRDGIVDFFDFSRFAGNWLWEK